MARIAFLECSRCGMRMSPDQPRTVCPRDGGALFVRYNISKLRNQVQRESLHSGPCTMWRYAALLPEAQPVTLGEGFTPMLRSRRWHNVFIKDEALNPTGSFKARGMAMAVTMARAYGLRKLAVASAGNAASALAAYAAAAGLEAFIFMPRDVARANLVECENYGARVTLVDGLISHCARLLSGQQQSNGWFDLATLKEPFRVEGKKTMAYELGEQLGWKLPQAIVYPTGGGVGLIGMWKGFEELQELGWIGKQRPKMVCVQSSGCAPIVQAWDEGKETCEEWPLAETVAAGLRVPKAYGDDIILNILKRSGGTAVAVSDGEIMDALHDWAEREGIFAAPEGAASLAAYRRLLASGFLKANDVVVLFNTGSGLKYVDVIDAYRKKVHKPPTPTVGATGGIIAPY